MKKKILIVSPHPDDETLGCGGYILKYKNKFEFHLLLVTKMKTDLKDKKYLDRVKEIKKIKKEYKFKSLIQLNYNTAEMDKYLKNEVINNFSKIIKNIKPETIMIPSDLDVHTDHKIINECMISASKSFRNPFIKKILEYEVISETNFSLKNAFIPNHFVNISNLISKKINILKIYKSEIKKHPFPRSIDSIKSLAILRGSQAGCKYAEAFNIIFSKIL